MEQEKQIAESFESKQKNKHQTNIYSLLTSRNFNFAFIREKNEQEFLEASKRNTEQVPNQVHYIWLGSDLPPKYRINMLRGKKINPHYNFNLWYCKEILQKETQHSLQAFAQTNGIILRNITDYQFENAKYIQDAIRDAEWAKAADILRIEKHFAGIYLDTDATILRRFPNPEKIDLGYYGILLGIVSPEAFSNSLLVRSYEGDGEDILSFYRQQIRDNLDEYEKLNGRTDGFSGSKASVETLLETTGPYVLGLSIAYFYVYKHNNDPDLISDMPDLLMNTGKFCFDIGQDGSIEKPAFVDVKVNDCTHVRKGFEHNVIKKGFDVAASTIQIAWRKHAQNSHFKKHIPTNTTISHTLNRPKLQECYLYPYHGL